MIQEVTINNATVPISLEPISLPLEEGSLLGQLTNAIITHERKYAVVNEDTIHLEVGRAVYLSGLLISAIESSPEIEGFIGRKITFIVPFDNACFIGIFDIQSNFIQVVKEEIISANEALADLQKIDSPVLVQGGHLTADFIERGLQPIPFEEISLKTKTNTFKRAKDLSFFLTYGIGLFITIIALFAAAQGLQFLYEEEQIENPLEMPTTNNNLGSAIDVIAERVPKYNPLFSYNFDSAASATIHGGAFILSGLYSQGQIPEHDYYRIKQIADDFDAEINLTSNGWQILGINSPAALTRHNRVDLPDISIQSEALLKFNDHYLYSVTLGDRISINRIMDYFEHDAQLVIKHPSKNSLIGLSALLKSYGVIAEYTSHSFTLDKEKGLLSELTLNFKIKGV